MKSPSDREPIKVPGTIDQFEKNESPLLEIVPVWGISPRVSIDLGEGIKIVLIQDLPPSRFKDLFTGKKRHRYSFDIANSSPQPGAAIVKETVHGPLYESSTSEAASASRRQGELILSALMAPTEAGKQAALAKMAKTMDPLKAARETTSIYNSAEELALVVALCTTRPIFPLAEKQKSQESFLRMSKRQIILNPAVRYFWSSQIVSGGFPGS